MASLLNNTTFNATSGGQYQNQNGPLNLIVGHAYLSSFAALVAGLYVLAVYFTPRASLDEPPLISHPVPFIGHLLGIIINGVSYFDKIGQQVKQPIFTLPILNAKTYVITSPSLTIACMRETRTLSFNPFIIEVFRRLAHLSHADMAATALNMDSKSEPSYMSEMHRAEYAALAPSEALDEMNAEVVSNLTSLLSKALPTDDEALEIDLYDTLRSTASLAAVRATYGPQNPFDANPSLLKDFWLFESQLKFLLVDVAPGLVSRRAHQARSRLIEGFTTYYNNQNHLAASQLVRHRYDVALKWGVEPHVVPALDLGLCFGVLANAMPTVFWLLTYIYSDPTLLQRIRDETSHLVHPDSTTGEVHIDLRSDRHLRSACPLLTSTFHETLRVISSSLSSGRFVLQDTVLVGEGGERYVLKKGGTVQIPSHSLHHPPLSSNSTSSSTDTPDPASPFATGSPHADFDAARFVHLGAKVAAEPERTINGSFRAFGGGSSLCPGRKFAFVEIVGAAVVFCQMYDLLGVEDGKDGVVLPAGDVSKVALAVSKPRESVRVVVKRRAGLRGKVVRGDVSGSGRERLGVEE